MQTSGDSPVPGADVSLVPQLDPRLLEVRHVALLVLFMKNICRRARWPFMRILLQAVNHILLSCVQQVHALLPGSSRIQLAGMRLDWRQTGRIVQMI